jgi:hypothetical protein
MSFYCPAHFVVQAVVRVEKVGTDEQQDDVGGVKSLMYLAVPTSTCGYLAVVPASDDAIALERREMSLKIGAQFFVPV